MDLTIPYTFYPTVLPHGISWVLFLFAVIASLAASAAVAFLKRPWLGLLVFVPILTGLILFTMGCSMVITFFIHDL